MDDSQITTHSEFSQSHRGKVIKRLLITSLIVSTLSFALNMVRFASDSIFIIPGAWGLTIFNHITLLYLLAKHKKQPVLPNCITPPFLKHPFNIWLSAFISLTWLAGGLTTICIVVTFYSPPDISGINALDMVAGVLGIVEAGLLITLVVYFWKASSREGRSEPTCNCTHTSPLL